MMIIIDKLHQNDDDFTHVVVIIVVLGRVGRCGGSHRRIQITRAAAIMFLHSEPKNPIKNRNKFFWGDFDFCTFFNGLGFLKIFGFLDFWRN